MKGGLFDWWAQRISAVFISLFVLPAIGLWFLGYLPSSFDWYLWLSLPAIKILTALALLGYAVHIRIGMWVVITDYVPKCFQMASHWVADAIILLHVLVGTYLIWIF